MMDTTDKLVQSNPRAVTLKLTRIGLYALATVVCACAVFNLVPLERFWFTSSTSSIIKFSRADQQPAGTPDGIDLPLIINSLTAKPTFASTFAWWHTSWIPKVPFWRPLTVQTFWLEKQAFGLYRFDKWMAVSLIAHIACLAAFGWFALTLTRRPSIAWLAVLFFAGWHGAPWVSNSALYNALNVPANVAIDGWKNQPDLFADLFVFLSLTLTFRGRYYAAIACAFAAVAFKESGWVAWPLDGLALIATGKLKSVGARPILTAVIVIVGLVVLRASAGPAVFHGYHQGANSGWLTRLDHSIGAPYVLTFLTAPYNWLLGNAIGAAIIFRRRKWASAIIITGGLVLSTAWQAHTLGEGVDVVIASYTDPAMGVDVLINTFAVAFAVAATYLTFESNEFRRYGVFALCASLIAALPAVGAVQVMEHAFHQTYAFQSLWWAIAIYCTAVKVIGLYRSLRSGPNKSELRPHLRTGIVERR